MAPALRPSEAWKNIPWKKIQRNVFRLQKRIYQAKQRGEVRTVHNLQRLLLRSWSARLLAVRRVTQDNRGKKTPGVDGVASLTPKQRWAYVQRLRNLNQAADPVRRTYLTKSDGGKRPLGIPTMLIRAYQALVKLALEPEWEAVFEPNSCGFRPGRSPHDAIEAVYNYIRYKPKFVLKADIEKCFDKIKHQYLLDKLCTIQPIAKLVRGWLKAGIVDQGQTLYPEEGVPQGGVISPLLMNIALQGLEEELVNAFDQRHKVAVIRFADDVVIMHHQLETLVEAKERAEAWLKPVGLQLNPNKTYISHTLKEHQGQVGFDFLGFNIKQYGQGQYKTRTYRGQAGFKTLIKPSKQAQKRHLAQLKQVIRNHRGASQAALIGAINPIIRGWANYYKTCVSKEIFDQMSYQLFHKLRRWAAFRHPRKSRKWQYRRYWSNFEGRVVFNDGDNYLFHYEQTKIKRHTKVIGSKSPFDGDWLYWAKRLQRRGLILPRFGLQFPMQNKCRI